MPSTREINEYYTVTVSADGRRRGVYFATADIYRRDNGEPFGRSFHGEGESFDRAEADALKKARGACPHVKPDGWRPAG